MKTINWNIIALVMLLVQFAVNASGQTRNEQDAVNIAKDYLSSSLGISNAPSPVSLKAKSRRAAGIQETPAFYIVNAEESNAFIIVAGDERMQTILGYSTNGSYTEDKIPVALKNLLKGYEKEFTALQSSEINVVAKTNRAPSSIVEPLIKTKWGQNGPYNLLCPPDIGDHAVTGCVATAMAQVMNYYQYPNTGQGICSYTTPTTNWFVYTNLSKTTFDWPLMLDEYSTYSKEQGDAVAELMFSCGASVEMNYNYTESGAFGGDVAPALINNFNYQNTAKYVVRADYTSEEWHAIIDNELQDGRPIIYDSFNQELTFGHSYVVDGIDQDGLYHINWGWDGNYDGYFALDALRPGDGRDISYEQDMTYGIQPKGYKLSYMINGELNYVTYLEAGSEIQAIVPILSDDYVFESWENVPSVMPAQNTVINGTAKRKEYTIKYVVDGNDYQEVSLAWGETITPIEDPVKEGYTFSGWSSIPKVMPKENITVTGSFAINSYTLTYLLDGETYKTETLEYGATITAVADPVEEGYTFSGWSEIPATMPAKDVVVTGTMIKDDETVHPDYSQTDGNVYISDASVLTGATKELPILLNNALSLSSFQFDIVLPIGFTLQSVTSGARIPTDSYTFAVNEQEDGSTRILCFSSAKNSIPGTSGDIAKLLLSVDNGVPTGAYAIKIKNQVLSYNDGTVKTPKTTYACMNTRLCNIDNVVNAVNFIMSGNPSSEDIALYDMNNDQELNVGDIILIVKSILNQGGGSKSVIRRASTTCDFAQFTAAYFELKVENNNSISNIRLVNSMAQSHQLMYQQKDANTYAVVVYSLSNQLMKPDNGRIVEVDTSGTDLIIQNITAATPEGDMYYYQDYGMPTGVHQLENDGNSAVIYDLKGNRLNGNALEKGIYIINGKKAVVK